MQRDPFLVNSVPTITLALLHNAKLVPQGTQYCLLGNFAPDVQSILLTAVPDVTNGQVWKGEATSLSTTPSVALFPTNAIITWNQVTV